MEKFTLIAGIVAGVCVAIFVPLYEILKKQAEKTPTKIDDVILDAFIQGVQYADKYFNGSTNENKRTKATIKALEILNNQGITEISDKVAGLAVETAVAKEREKELKANAEAGSVGK